MKDLLDLVMLQELQPSSDKFGSDPFGYAGNAWVQWVMATHLNGVGEHLDPEKPPTSENLKQPILWLSQSKALTVAAFEVINSEHKFEDYPPFLRGMIDSQFRAVGLMLIGYSLEVGLKGMIILREGTDVYLEREKKRQTFTHDLKKIAGFIPALTKKDEAILSQFTHFLTWAGRYPDPGFNRINFADDIHKVSEQHEITMGDVVELADRVLKHVNVVLSDSEKAE